MMIHDDFCPKRRRVMRPEEAARCHFIGSTGLLIAGATAAAGAGVAKVVGAVAQGDEAKRQQDSAIKAAQASPQELRQIEENLRQQEIVLTRERKMIEAVDPAIFEAARQAKALLEGKEANILGPVKRQRERQRQQLENRLRDQMGSGYETSSAGIEALSRFDAETNDLLAQQQDRAISTLLGTTQQASAISRGQEQFGIGLGNTALASMQNIKSREVAARTGTAAGMVQAAGGVANAIGDTFSDIATLSGFAATQGMSAKGAGDAFSEVVNSGPGYFDKPYEFGKASLS